MKTFQEISLRFPHLFESILNILDNSSLTNGRKVSKKWQIAKIQILSRAVKQFFELRSNDEAQYSLLHVVAGNGQFYFSKYIIGKTGNFSLERPQN